MFPSVVFKSGNNGPAVLGGAEGGPSAPSSLSPLEGQPPPQLDVWTMDSDLSDADSVGDLSFEAESPLAPPAELLERLPSCDWLLQGDRRQIFFPPLEAPGRPQEQRCWSPFLEHGRVPVVTEEVAREALLNFVNSKCCYGSAAATDLIIQELRQQTLCRVRCPSCSGAKRKAKPARRCPMCSGSGRQRCSTCSGRGNKTCATCKGEKKLLHFIQLVIVWKNSLFEFVSEHQLDCPGELLAKAKGETLFKDENTMRQTIELVPLTEVRYSYRGKTSVYYLYGTDHRVHVVDYPERYCCGCTII
ncbi:Suppressor of Stomatin mutant Uncoordination family member (ssu-2)-like protein [Camelus ferus]|nr:Suppressor of Stomatin mutant Uncoordination family member (ssu-2)-like protein [Camelus ferus]